MSEESVKQRGPTLKDDLRRHGICVDLPDDEPVTRAQLKTQSQRALEKQAEVWIVQRINELSPSMPKKEAVRQANQEWEERKPWEVHGPQELATEDKDSLSS